MDSSDRLSPPVRFLSRSMTSKRMLRSSRTSFAMSLVVLTLSGTSLGLGLTVDMYIYSLAVNSAPLLTPLILYEGIARKRNGTFLLKVHSIIMFLYLLLVFSADVTMMAYLSIVCVYCSRRGKEKCSASGSEQYGCGMALPGFANKFEVVCVPKATEIIDLVSVIGNILAMLALAAYLVSAHRLRVLLTQVTTQEHAQLHHEDLPEPIVLTVLGIKLSSRSADPNAEVAFPVAEKNDVSLLEIQPNVTIS